MRQPHQHVTQVVEAVAALFGFPEERWATLKRRLDSSLLSKISAFDLFAASRLPRNRVENFMRMIRDHPVFVDHALRDKCPSVVALQRWCIAASELLFKLHGDVLNPQTTPIRQRSRQETPDNLPAQVVAVPLTGWDDTDTSDVPMDSFARYGHEDNHLRVAARDEVPPSPRSIDVVSADACAGMPLDSNYYDDAGMPQLAQSIPSRLSSHPPSRLSSHNSQATIEEPDKTFGGLTVEPDLWTLSEAELMAVRDLKVGRGRIGSVTFHGVTDCRSLIYELQDLLVINQGEVVVYPDARLKPPPGEGLNKPASIVLYECMPATSQRRLADPKARERYRQRVANMTEAKGGVFEDYNCEDGTWKFRVDHF
jgi:hypothetical protein